MRRTILQAAMDAIVEYGYARVTTQIIVERAGVSRGAMLHHFPKKQDLLSALVTYIVDVRAAELDSRIKALTDEERTQKAKGLDIYLDYSTHASFVALVELSVAARTDPQLAAAFAPLLETLFKERYVQQLALHPEWKGQARDFETAADLARAVVTGIAVSPDIRFSAERTERLLALVKATVVHLRGAPAEG